MSKKDNRVYFLQSTYKECDPEILGAYKSMKGLCRGFADAVAQDCLVDFGEKDDDSDLAFMVKKVARKVARLLPDLLKVDFCEDECRDGRTVYGYGAMPVESDEYEEDDEYSDGYEEDDEYEEEAESVEETADTDDAGKKDPEPGAENG